MAIEKTIKMPAKFEDMVMRAYNHNGFVVLRDYAAINTVGNVPFSTGSYYLSSPGTTFWVDKKESRYAVMMGEITNMVYFIEEVAIGNDRFIVSIKKDKRSLKSFIRCEPSNDLLRYISAKKGA